MDINPKREEILSHYELEKKLAAVLRNSTREERQFLYGKLYDRLYQNVPYLYARSRSEELIITNLKSQIRLLSGFLNDVNTFLEIGPGNCSLSMEIAKKIPLVYAVDVSKKITHQDKCPVNFKLILSNGIDIPITAGSVDLAYSTQLIEHIHPGDIIEHFQNVRNALTPKGKYICITPNRLGGPYDISRGFDEVATGFHLKEYTNYELENLLKAGGFHKVRILFGSKGRYLFLPIKFIGWIEKIMEKLPYKLRFKIANLRLTSAFLGIKIIAYNDLS